MKFKTKLYSHHVLLFYQVYSSLIYINDIIFEAVMYNWHDRIAYFCLVSFQIETAPHGRTPVLFVCFPVFVIKICGRQMNLQLHKNIQTLDYSQLLALKKSGEWEILM